MMIPILCGFLALLGFAHAEYDAKLLTNWDAQNQAWTYSMHGCVGGTDSPGTANLGANGALEKLNGEPDDPAKKQVSKTLSAFNTASGVVGTPGTSMRNATATATWSSYTRTVTSQTWIFCNEQNYDGRFGVITEFSSFLESYVDNIFHHNR